ncbi:hypothetical protein G6F63_014768 [Rhizopus arrhizus]|nr:hypothetical protein G6F63_014768 [Rhizopus arrhizus]
MRTNDSGRWVSNASASPPGSNWLRQKRTPAPAMRWQNCSSGTVWISASGRRTSMTSALPGRSRWCSDSSSQSAKASRCRVRSDCETNRFSGWVACRYRSSRPSAWSITCWSRSAMRPAASAAGITWPAASTVPSAWRSRSSSWYCAVLPPATATIG